MNTAATQPQTGSLNLGMIGNCAISALIDDHARMVWCCLPRFDGDPVFNALLQPGDEGSHFAIELEDLASAHQWYEPNTAILRTQLFDKAGHGIEITDFAPRFYSRSRYFRPMTLVRTAPFAYLRLRRPEYTDAELQGWLTALNDAGYEEAFVFFKHEEAGAGPRLAKRMLALAAQ